MLITVLVHRPRDGFTAPDAGKRPGMETIIIIAVIVAVIVAILAVVLAKRRGEVRDAEHRHEAQERREMAKVSELEADRRIAEAEERAARAKRETIAAEQAKMAAASHRAAADDLNAQAADIDPDS
jgi:type II secretory pathway component PulK